MLHLPPEVGSPEADVCVIDSGAVEIMMGETEDDVSDVALTASGLGGVVAIRNQINITLVSSISSVATSVTPVAEFSHFPCTLFVL